MAELNFNANEIEPQGNFEVLPAGKYSVVITESEWKNTQNGAGRYLQLTFEIVEGEYIGRKLWERLNMENPSEKAVQIARKQLSSICRAVNVMMPKDSIELHDLPLTAIVKVRKNQNDELVNEIKGFEPKQTLAQARPQTAHQAPPWARK